MFGIRFSANRHDKSLIRKFLKQCAVGFAYLTRHWARFRILAILFLGLPDPRGVGNTVPGSWLLFGFDLIPLGIVSAVLVVMQGAVVGAWCFLCLVTAAISLILVVLAYDEVWSSML